ncbi:PTS sugar transporter subunit IIB [Spiroplasma sp. SV19]|uniref:PTS sugar transporter subunit IIB n=1 Tax=Spiroplasma sp. SV19 TaxID=2570468 RepID=UPI0024B87485|nr:PTS sugar transporter subunit IIB [Spiroplasma sp. SV19]
MKNIRILLSCSFGFSTSILVKKMENYFKTKSYPFTVEALNETSAISVIENYDVILIGPQVSYLLKKFKAAANEQIPVYIMETRSYGLQKVDLIIEKMLADMKEDGFLNEA